MSYYTLRGDGWDEVSEAGNQGLMGHTMDSDCDVAIDGGRQDDHEAECPECSAYIEDDAPLDEARQQCAGCHIDWDPDDDGACVECGVQEIRPFMEGHENDCDDPTWSPPQSIGRYFNAAGVRVEEAQDRVQLWISVGDPRGAFCMNFEAFEMDGKTELRLSVPTPSDGFGHMGLEPLASDGYYRVVGQKGTTAPSLRRAALDVLADLDHYVSTHGPGPDKRLATLREALGADQEVA